MERTLPERTSVLSREEVARGRLLRSMALCLLVGGIAVAGVTLFSWQQGQGSLLDSIGALGAALLGLAIFLLARRQAQRPAGLVLCALLLLAPTYYILLEGPKSTSILLLAVGVVFADFLLGGRSGPLAALFACLLYLGAGMVYLSAPPWLSSASFTSPFIGDAVTMVVVCLGLALTAGYFTREMKQALRATQEKEQSLRDANLEKDQLLAEITAREDGQRLLLERVRELGSPVIPLSAGVIAMPVIGTVDERRAVDVTRALLEGVEEQGARFAIIDVTGVPIVDERLGAALLRMAQGVRLLGAEPVLTGINPAVAESLMNLDLDFAIVTTGATLQEGLDYALRQEIAAAA